MAQAAEKLWTVAEFLLWEEQQPEKWELIDGQPRMMVGGTSNHHTIAANLVGELHSKLKGTPCRVYTEGIKVAAAASVTYPDVVVTCGRMAGNDTVVNEPRVIIEVLSPSTEAFDRGAKGAAYRSLPSLAHYLLVAQDTTHVEMFTRRGEGWDFVEVTRLDADVDLATIGVRLALREIYDRCFPEAAAG